MLVETDEGITGVGIGSHADIDRLFPAIEGEDPRGVTALYDRMLAQVFKSGHAGADFGGIGAIDTALWDIKAKAAGEPLWRLLGARDRFVPGLRVRARHRPRRRRARALYREFAERGLRAAKLKGGLDVDARPAPAALVRDVLAGQRRATRPDARRQRVVDAQAGRALRRRARGELDLLWVEEPLRRWDAAGHARLSNARRARPSPQARTSRASSSSARSSTRAPPDVVQAGARVGRHALACGWRPSPQRATCRSAPSATTRTRRWRRR